MFDWKLFLHPNVTKISLAIIMLILTVVLANQAHKESCMAINATNSCSGAFGGGQHMVTPLLHCCDEPVSNNIIVQDYLLRLLLPLTGFYLLACAFSWVLARRPKS